MNKNFYKKVDSGLKIKSFNDSYADFQLNYRKIIEESLYNVEIEQELNQMICQISDLISLRKETFNKKEKAKTNSINNRLKEYKKFLCGKINGLQSTSNSTPHTPLSQNKTKLDNETIIIYNPNLWNKECYELFYYLIDNYYKEGRSTIRNLTNIWFYFKNYCGETYKMYATKDLYKSFVKDNLNIEIKNFDKTPNYSENVLPILNELRCNFEDCLK